MTASELRLSFIEFFKSKDHTFVPSESLLPSSPNLLFTNAGMNQFVPYFLGERTPPNSRIVNSQKCIRAGGKHNDLEDVGFDTYHHTFFEMLGNWSVGNYFKKDAIHWAWELLTKVWHLPKNRLYVTVYKPNPGDPASFDQEAYDIWKDILQKDGLDPAIHIVYGNKKDNFWMMGDTGPCGPCSEVHVDLTAHATTKGSLVNKDSPLCMEIWNLVFIQFNALPDGSFKPLPAKHVDTGMGLERIAGIIATTKNFTHFDSPPSNYNSDLFTEIFKEISKNSHTRYHATVPKDRNNMSAQELSDCAFRVIADHIRTLSFSIADGILPGNEGRNYVLRRILRRAVLFTKKINFPPNSLSLLVDPLIHIVSDHFPELVQHRELIKKVIATEEHNFQNTIDRGLQLLDKITQKSSTISGEDAFTLYDTYGFPIDLTQLIARERQLSIDLQGFQEAMENQRQRARSAQKKTSITLADTSIEVQKTPFVGYDPSNLQNYPAKILDVITIDNKSYVILDSTPFYPEMGGQVGDSGTLLVSGIPIPITNTIQNEKGTILHEIAPPSPIPSASSTLLPHPETSNSALSSSSTTPALTTTSPLPTAPKGLDGHPLEPFSEKAKLFQKMAPNRWGLGAAAPNSVLGRAALDILETLNNLTDSTATVTASIDLPRRLEIQRHHTATHLLHWALRKNLGTHIRQAGSLVAPDRLRFDFAHFEPIPSPILSQIESDINQAILHNDSVTWKEIPFDQKPTDCIAFFGEKYGNVVRMVNIDGFSKELCGGTHVTNTGEIGLLKIISESAIAAGTRRIEALVGSAAINYINNQLTHLKHSAELLSCNNDQVEDRVHSLLHDNASLKKQLRSHEQRSTLSQLDALLTKVTQHHNISWVIADVQAPSANDLRDLAIQLSKKLPPSSAIILAAPSGEDKLNILALCSEDAIKAAFKAGALVQDLCSLLGGRGGGKPDFAMGGAKLIPNFQQIVNAYRPFLPKH